MIRTNVFVKISLVRKYQVFICGGNRMYKCFRLTRGMDLKKEIESYVIDNDISGVILCAVGSLSKINIRLASATTNLEKEGMYEIVGITGTLSKDGVHIHIAVADEQGNTIGGHLKDGCIINTTAEIVLEVFEEIEFRRKYDAITGYSELSI